MQIAWKCRAPITTPVCTWWCTPVLERPKIDSGPSLAFSLPQSDAGAAIQLKRKYKPIVDTAADRKHLWRDALEEYGELKREKIAGRSCDAAMCSILAGHGRTKKLESLVATFDILQPEVACTLIKARASTGDFARCIDIYKEVISRLRHAEDVVPASLQNTMVRALMKCDQVDAARSLMNEWMQQQQRQRRNGHVRMSDEAVLFNARIQFCDSVQQMKIILSEMEEMRVRVDAYTLANLLSGCGRLRDYASAVTFLRQFKSVTNSAHRNNLLAQLCQQADHTDAVDWFLKLEAAGLVNTSTFDVFFRMLSSAIANKVRLNENSDDLVLLAERLFHKSCRQASNSVWTAMFAVYADVSRLDKAADLLLLKDKLRVPVDDRMAAQIRRSHPHFGTEMSWRLQRTG
ncbi:hypothetical protein DIPPA_70097 [Diplonema papillatum]|nr:hypothetical protein DIPPA_70097 [Diplonema papillatum]